MAFPNLKLIVAHFGQPCMEQTAILMCKKVDRPRTPRDPVYGRTCLAGPR